MRSIFKTSILTVLLFVAFLLSAGIGHSATAVNPSAASYAEELQLIVNVAKETFGVDEVSIGGGTARSLVQHLLLGTPFVFRDFDIVFSANQEVTAAKVKEMGLILQKKGLGRFSEENLRPRPRYNPQLPAEQAAKYNAGYGFYVISNEGMEFDVTVFHSEAAMDLNGILDIDKLRVRLDVNKSVADLFSNKNLFQAAIVDPDGGLSVVLKGGNPKVSNWPAIQTDPTNAVIRVVRGLAKFNALPVDELTARKIREFIQQDKKGNALQMSRNLLKLLEDKVWQSEFDALVKLGLFGSHFKSFASALDNKAFLTSENINDRVFAMLDSANKSDSIYFLKLIFDLEPDLIKDVLPRIIKSKNLKVGYYTGEFAPFHKGHLGVVQTALLKGNLDLVFVIPTPHVTNDPKTVKYSQLEWEERRAFTKAGLNSEGKAWLWPAGVSEKADTKLAGQIQALEKLLSLEKPLTHIFGMDSFHRVVHRDLLQTSIRPRIAVTRPGVPIPEFDPNSDVRILENIVSDPISATRILHQISATGQSDDIAPEVLKLVKQTARYQGFMKDYLKSREESEKAIKPYDDIAKKVLIWDPREGRAGLYEENFPTFKEAHGDVLDRLQNLGAKKLIVYITSDSPARASWIKAALKYKGSLDIIVSEDYAKIPDTQRVMVVHSGMANESMKKSQFVDRYRGKKGLIIYETPDQPVSPLIKSMGNIKVLNGNIFQCKALFAISS